MSGPSPAHSVARTSPTQPARHRRPLPQSVVLGVRDHLVAESWITAAQFQEGLRLAEAQHRWLPDALVELFHIPETAAYEALSAATGVELVDLDAIPISPLAIQLIPERIARRCAIVPVAEDTRLTFATSQPFSTETDQDISFASGRHPEPRLARPSQIAAALDRIYPGDHASDPTDDDRPLPKATKKRRVLVADDDRMIRMLVRMLLEKEGYEVIEAINGREAVDAVVTHGPDLLITDLLMPEVDGFDAVGSLRSETSGRHLPVIVLTAEPAAIAEKTALFLGADDYVTKPFDAEVLLGRVRGVFVRRLPIAN